MSQIATLPSLCNTQQMDFPRLGLVALATDLTVERDATRLISPDEAVVHVSRVAFENPTTPENLLKIGPGITGAADLLVPSVDLAGIAFACTAASVTIRNDVVRDAVAQVRPGVPVVTPTTAALCALRAFGAGRIALLTPYLVDTTQPMVSYFGSQGITVVKAACFNMADDRDMARIDRASLIEAAVSLDNPQVDALFLSCTALPAVDVIDAVEARIGKPVITSNQAMFWALRGLAGLTSRPNGFGRLFDQTWTGADVAP